MFWNDNEIMILTGQLLFAQLLPVPEHHAQAIIKGINCGREISEKLVNNVNIRIIKQSCRILF